MTRTGTFLVTAADEESAVLSNVTDGQVCTLADNPGFAAGQIVEAALRPAGPMEAVWEVADLWETRDVTVTESDERPTKTSREVAADLEDGDLEVRERAGEGAIHVISVPEAITGDAVEDALDDEQTLRTAARLGVDRVEVRSAPGVVTVRYLP